jgi:hypothetical protein
MIAADALTGTGPVYSPAYYSRAADYQKILDECRLICQHEIRGNRAPDDRVCVSTRLDLVLDEMRSVVTRLEAMEQEGFI